jgi:hypothetical protein
LATVIALNSHGARQLRHGSFLASAFIFQRAMTLLRSIDPKDMKDEVSVLDVKELGREPSRRRHKPFVWHSAGHDTSTPPSLHSSVTTDHHQNGDFFVYRHPLELTTFSHGNDDDWNAALMACSSVLLFNLALAWHLIGFTSSGCAGIHFAKASRLYNLLLHFLDATVTMDGVHSESILALECLVLNNLAALCRDHGAWFQYQWYIQVCDVRLRTGTNALKVCLPHQEVQELLLNVWYATMLPLPAAPTA